MRLPILMYHTLDDSGSPVSVAPEMFRQHLARLRAGGYTVLPMGEALREVARGGRDKRIAACTFDDGYASVAEHAAPLLDAFGWRATVFPISAYVGGENQWPGQPSDIPRSRLASWSELQGLVQRGWEIGSHTRTHRCLAGADDDLLEHEVLGDRLELQQRLGVAVDVFAYPYGEGSDDPRVRAVVRRGFAAACTTEMGWATQRSDHHALQRLEMWYFSQPGLHRLLGSRLMRPYVTACRLARMRRGPRMRPTQPSRTLEGLA